ncbi:dethiobiotin synthase [Helicobacter sp. 11S03491-1]|uniref:dethiobiotin synthase n=1 Tax=Helicobacter sp. 11S03491-1 TaxID=1476196 RepID=UPI000BA70AA6|nr:dethiobiotin synthase [Helicobacter sp. 11S03491-1]PAF43324.1 dethiobiotin synthase [Helicobacter sp. 11S03491-1]
MKSLFISATNTNIGKTYTAHFLSDYFNQKGIKTLIAKPIETGNDGSGILDCEAHLNKGRQILPQLRLEDINFYRYVLPASPFVAQLQEENAPKADFSYIAQKINNLSSFCDLLLVEGAGGLMVPIDEKNNMLDLARFLNAHLLLVSGDRLGMINDLVLNKEFLASHDIPCTYVINLMNPQIYRDISKPYIDYLNTTSKSYVYLLQKDIVAIASEILLFCRD